MHANNQHQYRKENVTMPVFLFLRAATSMVISGLSVFFLWFVHERWQNILMSCIFGAVSTIGFNSLDVLQTELFPTDVR